MRGLGLWGRVYLAGKFGYWAYECFKPPAKMTTLSTCFVRHNVLLHKVFRIQIKLALRDCPKIYFVFSKPRAATLQEKNVVAKKMFHVKHVISHSRRRQGYGGPRSHSRRRQGYGGPRRSQRKEGFLATDYNLLGPRFRGDDNINTDNILPLKSLRAQRKEFFRHRFRGLTQILVLVSPARF